MAPQPDPLLWWGAIHHEPRLFGQLGTIMETENRVSKWEREGGRKIDVLRREEDVDRQER